MKLSELQPRFLRDGGEGVMVAASTMHDAHAVAFLCPKCFADHGGAEGAHELCIWFRGREERHCWQASGSSLADLTLAPSIQVHNPCKWHGYIRNGAIEHC